MQLEVRGLVMKFGNTTVLDQVSFALSDGESVAVTGPSGSGKSTLLSIVGLLLQPTAGVVKFDGRQVTPKQRRSRILDGSISWVFQTTNCIGSRSVFDNVALALRASGVRPQAELIESALAAVGLRGFENRMARTLSGGELQRVCIARAAVTRPRLLFADEPTGQLDRSTSEAVLEALHQARSSGASMLIATHDQMVVESCDRSLGIEEITRRL